MSTTRTDRTLGDVLAALPDHGERGVRFVGADGSDRCYAYPRLRLEVCRLAAKLTRLGVRPGERVGLILPDHEHFLLGFLGTVVLGGVAVPIASRGGGSPKRAEAYAETVAHVLRASEARLALCYGGNRELLQGLLEQSGLGLPLVAIESLLDGDGPAAEPAPIGPDELCFLQFTSGSTSMPKGVMVSHRNVVANAEAFYGRQGCLQTRDDDVALGWLPLFHDMGLMGFALGPLVVNVPSVFLPTEVFGRRPWTWLSAMSRYRATITFAPNFAFELAARLTRERDLDGLDLRHVRVAGCGGEPINAETLHRFVERFGPVGLRPEALVPCYGMAEATVAISFHQHGTPVRVDRVDPVALRGGFAAPAASGAEIVSCGRPVIGHEVRIVNERGEAAQEREVGEICFRGESVTGGYYLRPDATAEVFRDGWLHTGDLGYLVDGEVHICGRQKDVVIANGVNYYPQDIERAVCDACEIDSTRVVAFSTFAGGRETVVVCLEPKIGQRLPELRRAVTEAVEERVGLRVHHVALLERGELTLTSSGKVQRRKTKQAFEAGALAERKADEGVAS